MSQITPGPSTETGTPQPGDRPGEIGREHPVATEPAPDAAHEPAHDPGHEPAHDAGHDGRSTRWADHRESRRAELVRVARRTVHHQGPDVSMDEIAAAAGTSKSIVYRYFTDKVGLQIAVAEAVVLQMRGALEGVLRIAPTPRDGLRAMVAVYLEMIESSPNVYAFVTRDGSVESGGPLGHFLDSVTALVAAPFARALAETSTEPVPLDDAQRALAEVWAAGAVGFVRGSGEWWLAHRDQPGGPDRGTVTAQIAAWLWAGPVGLLARDRGRASAPETPADPTRTSPTHAPATTSPAARPTEESA